MSKKKNKVRFGLKNCHYAKATFDEDGNVTYAKPVRMPGAVSLSMDPEGENENFYADDIVYYVINNNAGYEGDLELALIPEEFLTDILHEEADDNGVLAENANNTFERFALLFEFTGDAKAIRHVLYCCSASRPSMEGETAEDEKEVQTEELSIIASALANGYVKAKTSANTSKAIYDAWYDEVYQPQVTETPDEGGEDETNGGATEDNGSEANG
jgi:phi13 family phage major tail protein